MADTFSMADQFKGLPMGDLIGGPLQAACDAQVRLALATASFIQQIGFMPPPPANPGAPPDPANPPIPSQVRTVSFKFDRPSATQPPAPVEGGAATTAMETVELTVPLLAIVKVPALAITTVDITFDMEVKNSERSTNTEDKKGAFSADASVGWGPFSLKVHVEGSVATHQENTRETDQSAKYHVEVKAEDKGMPEGLSRVLDMMLTAIAPKSVTPVPAASDGGGGVQHGLVDPTQRQSALAAGKSTVTSDGLDHADSTENTDDLYHLVKVKTKG